MQFFSCSVLFGNIFFTVLDFFTLLTENTKFSPGGHYCLQLTANIGGLALAFLSSISGAFWVPVFSLSLLPYAHTLPLSPLDMITVTSPRRLPQTQAVFRICSKDAAPLRTRQSTTPLPIGNFSWLVIGGIFDCCVYPSSQSHTHTLLWECPAAPCPTYTTCHASLISLNPRPSSTRLVDILLAWEWLPPLVPYITALITPEYAFSSSCQGYKEKPLPKNATLFLLTNNWPFNP